MVHCSNNVKDKVLTGSESDLLFFLFLATFTRDINSLLSVRLSSGIAAERGRKGKEVLEDFMRRQMKVKASRSAIYLRC